MSEVASERAACEYVARFAQSDEALVASLARGRELRAECDALKAGWNDLVQVGDHEEIARRSIRLGEIDRELARIGQ